MASGHIARFYVAQIPEKGVFALTPEQSRHAKALRIATGAPVELFDGKNEYAATLTAWEKLLAILNVTGKSESPFHF